ncbi:MAG TPA: hypothetical protein VNG51_24290 [Ktedonobacteraceae bacterium]|nr:hypothetical protein [Ktedonobacteraceae bacterium]
MLCNFCNIARLDNEAPCPNCGAPSPLRGRTNGAFGTGEATGRMEAMGSSTEMTNEMGSPFSPLAAQYMPQTPQVAEQPQQQPFPSQPLQTDRPSLLPAIYQGGIANQQGQASMMMSTGALMNGSGALIPLQDTGAMLSTLPLNEGAIYVAPMYTKPRPLIPRYRAISGLISVLIVVLLACGTAGYYAKSSNQFAFLRQIYGAALPANVKPAAAPALPDPKQSPDYGPAANIITSAATNTHIDPQSYVSEQPAKTFQVNQTIYLTYSVQPPKNSSGTLVINWYTNNTFYQASPPKVVTNNSKNVGSVLNGYATQAFSQPLEGKVVLLWNNQPGITLYFVVR